QIAYYKNNQNSSLPPFFEIKKDDRIIAFYRLRLSNIYFFQIDFIV
ncbi:hypothetical protein HMPREF3217_00088, partial [Finegoldia magna]